MLKVTFWILLSIVAYTYFGYALLLFILRAIKLIFRPAKKQNPASPSLPVTLLIAAFNEKDFIDEKMRNTNALKYPENLLNVVWVTDGSDDGTPEFLKDNYPEVTVLHSAKRKGKTAALNRAMSYIETPVTIFCDANTLLDPLSVSLLVEHFSDPKIGCVAGEKRIDKGKHPGIAGAGEGTYWQYESLIKKLESDFYSTLAAAGELYALRTNLFKQVSTDSIIDDFVISLSVAMQGYRIAYEPRAFAIESPSADLKEELKRKIRIASGGIQTLFRFPGLLNFFKHGFYSFEFLSHKVMRWLVVPVIIPIILVLNILICYIENFESGIFLYLLVLQGIFYFLVLVGKLIGSRSVFLRILFLPYYFIVINYSQIAGLLRYLSGKHDVVWEKARRAKSDPDTIC